MRECNDRYGFGCTNKVDSDDEIEIEKIFYKKGEFFMGVCKTCVLKHHADMYKTGDYNYYKKKKIIESDFNITVPTGG